MERLQKKGNDSLGQHLQSYKAIVQEKSQAFRVTNALIREDLDGTRVTIEESLKRSTEAINAILNPAAVLFKKFKAETWKLKKAIWLSAVSTALSFFLPFGGWLFFQYQREHNIAEMWRMRTQRINQYVMGNFYPALDEEGKNNINEYYTLFGLTTPEEQKGILE